MNFHPIIILIKGRLETRSSVYEKKLMEKESNLAFSSSSDIISNKVTWAEAYANVVPFHHQHRSTRFRSIGLYFLYMWLGDKRDKKSILREKWNSLVFISSLKIGTVNERNFQYYLLKLTFWCDLFVLLLYFLIISIALVGQWNTPIHMDFE